jgi:hypothetical protein
MKRYDRQFQSGEALVWPEGIAQRQFIGPDANGSGHLDGFPDFGNESSPLLPILIGPANPVTHHEFLPMLAHLMAGG